MAETGLFINKNLCDLCGQCLEACPFDAIEINETVEINAACRLCKLCVKACPKNAIRLEERNAAADLSSWNGILVYAEQNCGIIHPVTYELIGEAFRLLPGGPVHCVMAGDGITSVAGILLEYGVSGVFAYDHEAFRHFRADVYANALAACVNEMKPAVVLVGATGLGRSLAPRAACMLKTGLTADCTKLELRPGGALVQIRPAFGGNIMAQIVTPDTRPQFATVRYKVMEKAEAKPIIGLVERMPVTPEITASGIEVLGSRDKPKTENISEAETIIAVGRGLKDKKDLKAVYDLADNIGAAVAATRPLVEAGWFPYTHQIGLSGRTVRPKLILTLGISGAVQFTACMRDADCIIAVNSDKRAPIFDVAHYGLVGDLYEILPLLREKVSARGGV